MFLNWPSCSDLPMAAITFSFRSQLKTKLHWEVCPDHPVQLAATSSYHQGILFYFLHVKCHSLEFVCAFIFVCLLVCCLSLLPEYQLEESKNHVHFAYFPISSLCHTVGHIKRTSSDICWMKVIEFRNYYRHSKVLRKKSVYSCFLFLQILCVCVWLLLSNSKL